MNFIMESKACSSLLLYVMGVSFLFTSSGVAQVTAPTDGAQSGPEPPNIKKLMNKLFKDQAYDRDLRPVTHHSNTTEVQFSLAPKYIVDLVEDRNMLWLDSWIVLHWNDYRLTWNPDDYDGLLRLSVADHFIWQPDITVYNSWSWNIDPKANTRLLVYANGDIWHVPPAMTSTYCTEDHNVGSYPYDVMECPIVFGSWSHDGWQIDLKVLDDGEIYMDEFLDNNPRWDLLQEQVNITRQVNHYNCCEEPYVMIKFMAPIARRYPQELSVSWSPCVLVMALTLAMFWIRPDSGKKLILGPILVLVLCTLIVFVGTETKSSIAKLVAVSFLGSTLYAVASAVLLEIVVINISSINGPTRPPEVLVNLLSGPVGRNIAIYARWLDGTAGDKMQLKEDSEQIVCHPSAKDEWMLVGAAIDRLLFVIYIIVFAAIHRA